ncbi:hypothetical protein HMPREF1624_05763 [Sporothrix schenckii ATCC 58251]|uniref:Zn(2)-C6 fungal-type domain-containing protein n=1 Tax=Sporothrix schenckii (strain ATCC 58251 / de Perez 2211183) TaxID=1391915 RepID=U7PPS6_SPOS1|nr:hypothetical protein HMPREF1624_05763 [Sporothrix schenckii ATCC 58251]
MHSQSPVPLPQLSCEGCRTRKIKCDKQQPSCSACVATNVPCVPVHRLRLPRGRHVTNNAAVSKITTAPEATRDDLRRRIRRLEALVSQTSPASTSTSTSPSMTGTTASSSRADAAPSAPWVMHHPEHFWEELTEAVQELRDVVESSPEEAEDDTAQTHAEVSSQPVRPRDLSVLGLTTLPSHVLCPSHILLDRPLVAQLCTVYLDQVDPILKILHRPTIAQHLVNGASYLGYPEGHTSVAALDSAVLYVAVNSMDDEQCRALLGRDRAGLLVATRQACEAALERAGLLTTRDMTVLQAFVLYLAGRQVEEPSRAVWTLLAVAVRVARVLGVDTQQAKATQSVFVRQMRQHLWMTICLMDVQVAFNMTSQPLVAADDAQATAERMPRHVNDADFHPGTSDVDVPAERTGLTDTTYALLKYRTQALGRRSQFVPLADTEARQVNDDRKRRDDAQSLCDAFTREVMVLACGLDPNDSPLAWLVFHSTQCFVGGAQAALYKSQPDDTRTGRPGLLRACAQVLETTVLMHTDTRGKGFRWSMTVRWHILAMALAECYVCARAAIPDASLLTNVWPTMEAAYAHHASIIGRHRGGRLTGPLGKLMARTRQTVEAVIVPTCGRTDEAQAYITTHDAEPSDTATSGLPSMDTEDTPSVDSWSASWDACWDEFVSAAALDDDSIDTAIFDMHWQGNQREGLVETYRFGVAGLGRTLCTYRTQGQ